MTDTEAKLLWQYQVQLRRVASNREADSEAAIRRTYQQVLQKLQNILGKYYAAYAEAEDGTLTQGDLRAAGKYKNFLQDVVDNLSGVADPVDKQIRQTVEDTYTSCYDGMVSAVKQSTAGNASLHSALSGLSDTTPETVKHIVENPMKKLKLSTILRRRRSQIVTSTKKTLAVGLANGDSYTRMAQRIAENLNGDYKKAIRIVRTEANRAINRGFQDVTEEASELLIGSDYVEVKEWCSMEDESVRDTHHNLNGKKIHALDMFESHGAKAGCPGAFGVAEEDINCRCFLAYSFMLRSEFLAQGGVIPGSILKKEAEQNYEHLLRGEYSIPFAKAGGSKEITPQLAKEFSDEYDKFQERFGKLSSVRCVTIASYGNDGMWGSYNDNSNELVMFGAGGKDGKTVLAKVASEMKKAGKWSTSSPYHAFRHELGHAFQYQLKQTDPSYPVKLKKISEIRSSIFKTLTNLDESAIIEMKKQKLSIYGLFEEDSLDEFIAECVAECCSKKPRKTAKSVTDILLSNGDELNVD